MFRLRYKCYTMFRRIAIKKFQFRNIFGILSFSTHDNCFIIRDINSLPFKDVNQTWKEEGKCSKDDEH